MDDQGKPPFNDVLANELIGKYLIIGLTFLSQDEKVTEQAQKHGTIKSVDADNGICVELNGVNEGELYWLPPDLRCIHKALPGEYELDSTKEIISNPDYTCVYTIYRTE